MQSRLSSGAFESVQQIAFPAPVVERSAAGARRLGELYWCEVERSTFGIVRARLDAGGLDVRLLGIEPALLRFGQPEHAVSSSGVHCLYPIRGGLLARAPVGSISFTQAGSEAVEVSSAIRGFFPRLAARRQRHRWNGLLYGQIQARLHVALGRRYFARLWRDAIPTPGSLLPEHDDGRPREVGPHEAEQAAEQLETTVALVGIERGQIIRQRTTPA